MDLLQLVKLHSLINHNDNTEYEDKHLSLLRYETKNNFS